MKSGLVKSVQGHKHYHVRDFTWDGEFIQRPRPLPLSGESPKSAVGRIGKKKIELVVSGALKYSEGFHYNHSEKPESIYCSPVGCVLLSGL